MVNRQLFLKAATTSQLVGRIVETQMEPLGVPGYLLALLTHVRDLAPVSPTAVSLASGAPPTTLRDNIQRLVDRGLVERVPNPDDGRSYLLELTESGAAVTHAAGEALHGAYLELERQLPTPLGDVEHTLDELNEALRMVLGDGAPASG
jgi:DNA-binding MarR family transcriptional regulator